MQEISKERFEAWLFAQPLDRVINATNCHHCFLGCFVQETTKHYPTIYGKTYRLCSEQENAIPLPDWFLQLLPTEITYKRNSMTCKELQARYITLFGPVFPDATTGDFVAGGPTLATNHESQPTEITNK